jgi:hypothetical protein
MAIAAEIIEGALKLSRTDRSYLAAKLLESLDDDDHFSAEEIDEFKERSREIREGLVKPQTLEQLQQEVAARLA